MPGLLAARFRLCGRGARAGAQGVQLGDYRPDPGRDEDAAKYEDYRDVLKTDLTDLCFRML